MRGGVSRDAQETRHVDRGIHGSLQGTYRICELEHAERQDNRWKSHRQRSTLARFMASDTLRLTVGGASAFTVEPSIDDPDIRGQAPGQCSY
jgi:hypothetical protein